MVLTMASRDVAEPPIKASGFTVTCLRSVDDVAERGEPLVITKDGRPVARLGPVVARPRALFGSHEGEIEILSDIIAAVDVGWEAMR